MGTLGATNSTTDLPGVAGGTDVAVADGGTGSSTAANARTALGLVIGTDVRAQGSGDPTVPAFATPAVVLGTAAAAGAASTVIRSDSTIVAFDATVPTTQAFGDAAATGSAAAAARRDHLHGIPSPRFGRTVNAGVVNYQLPGHAVTATSTWASVINQLSYWPMWTPTVIAIDQVAFNVTTTPASAAKVRIGIYTADSNNQPSGNPLSDSEVAVANGFTGVKTATIAITVGPGPFLICVNNDVTMTMRGYTGALIAGHIPVGMGSATVMSYMAIASTYGAMPTPGTAWTFDTGGANMPVVVRVSTP